MTNLDLNKALQDFLNTNLAGLKAVLEAGGASAEVIQQVTNAVPQQPVTPVTPVTQSTPVTPAPTQPVMKVEEKHNFVAPSNKVIDIHIRNFKDCSGCPMFDTCTEKFREGSRFIKECRLDEAKAVIVAGGRFIIKPQYKGSQVYYPIYKGDELVGEVYQQHDSNKMIHELDEYMKKAVVIELSINNLKHNKKPDSIFTAAYAEIIEAYKEEKVVEEFDEDEGLSLDEDWDDVLLNVEMPKF